MRTRKFLGSFTASPVTVNTRYIRGLPFLTASYTAITVPTLSTTQPASAGSILELTKRPVTALIRERSAPSGYLVLTTATDTLSTPSTAFFMISIALGLLFSMQIRPLQLSPKSFSIILSPSTIISGFSSIIR